MRKYNFKESRLRKYIRKNGFYIAVAVTAVGIGIVGYMSVSDVAEIFTPKDIESNVQSESPAGVVMSDVPAENESESVTSQTASEKKTESTKEEKKDASSANETFTYPDYFVLPVDGQVYNDYSDGLPVFDNTLNDWRAHNGIDLRAEQGSPVMAVADGKVKSVGFDESWGYTVVIDHGEGLEARYCNLQEEVFVGEGEMVKRGETIGGVGDNAYMECLDGAHLHFEMTMNGINADPLVIMGREQTDE